MGKKNIPLIKYKDVAIPKSVRETILKDLICILICKIVGISKATYKNIHCDNEKNCQSIINDIGMPKIIPEYIQVHPKQKGCPIIQIK